MRRKWMIGGGVLAALLALGAAPFAIAYWTGPHSMERVDWRAPRASARTWDEALSRPGVIEWEALETGSIDQDPGMLLADAPGRDAAIAEAAPLRVYAHILRHPSRGDWLVDAGLDDAFAQDSHGNLGYLGRAFLDVMNVTFHQRAGSDLGSQLSARHVRPRGVFITHLHFDHTEGLSALDPSTQVIVGAGEPDDIATVMISGHLDRFRRLHGLRFERSMAPLGPSLDVFGDGSLWAISTPGHSNGHTSYLVMTTRGPVFLVGDASHFRSGWDHDVPPDGSDVELSARSLRSLRAFARRYPQVLVFWGHEAP